MFTSLDYLRDFNFLSVCLRLIIAMIFGGLIGFERGRKGRAAGLRTYMLVCIGSSLTVVLGQYQISISNNIFYQIGNSTDITRFAAQVINGIGFLGAGTILVTKKQEVKGLTTAAALWASACVGLAIGAGFYECVIFALILIILVIRVLPYIETIIIERSRNINLYIEFDCMDNFNEIISNIKAHGVQIFQIELERGRSDKKQYPNAIFSIRLNNKQSHTEILSSMSDVPCIHMIEEI